MKANLNTTLALQAEAAGNQSSGSSLINYPGSPADVANDQTVKDKARERLVRPFASPDVDAEAIKSTNETRQKDNAGFIGKRYRVQDTKYGHYTSEHDNSSSAALAEETRPYSRVLKHTELHNTQLVRNKAIKKAALKNPDTQ